MVKARKYVVKTHFEGVPKREDFEIVESALPPVQNGEILVRAEWISVDPYQRAYNPGIPVPYDQFGYQVGVVEDSKDPRFPVGCRVVSHKGWCDYYVTKASDATGKDKPYKLPPLKALPASLGVGALGMPGVTAYFGLLEVCKPKQGETVVVTGAAGAVGSLVGQIAKIKGCRVIGFAGSDAKVEWLKQLGFDVALNYKTVDAYAALKEAAPSGVDCFFDNVGGELSSIIINQMNTDGRVCVCGSISVYNASKAAMPKATILQPAIVSKQLKIEGFTVWKWLDRSSEAVAELVKWIESGQLQAREHISEGFDNIYDAFIGMLAGENFGKAVVKI